MDTLFAGQQLHTAVILVEKIKVAHHMAWTDTGLKT